MYTPPSPVSRIGLALLMIAMATSAAPAVLGRQGPPTGQMPDALRGAKIYQLPTKGGQPAPNPAVFKSLTFQDINFERLLLGLSLSLRPVDRSATIEHIYFQDVKVNGIPVHIETFDQEFKLSNKETVDLPAPLKCSIVFSDLDSMRPVRDMVDKDTILITGQTFIEVKLNTLEKVALRAKQLVIPVNLNDQVPLNFFQGNPLLHMTADTILDTLTNPTSAAAIAMAKEHLAKLHMDQSLGDKVKSALYLIFTQYTVRDPKSKAAEQFSQSGTGFLVSADGKMLTSYRVIAPWKFDSQVDFLIEQHHLEIDKESVKTYAWPAGTQVMGTDGQPNLQAAISTEKQSLKILRTPPDEIVQQEYQDPDSGEKATLHLQSGGAGDVALLQLVGTAFMPLSLPDAAAGSPSASQLVMGGYPFGLSQPQIAPRLLRVSVNWQGDSGTMDHQVDPGESGAPLLDADGKVAALATSAAQCVPIQVARKLIP